MFLCTRCYSGAGKHMDEQRHSPALEKITFFGEANHKQTVYTISEGLSLINTWGADFLSRTQEQSIFLNSCIHLSQPKLTYLELTTVYVLPKRALELTTVMGRPEHPFISVFIIPFSHLSMLGFICCLTF